MRRVFALLGTGRASRLRVIDADRVVIADSRPAVVRPRAAPGDTEARGSFLYPISKT